MRILKNTQVYNAMDIEEKWFRQLTEKRSALARQLKDPAASGFWNSVVDKYSDEAHFLYELLQNADDAEATEVKILLHKDKLEFTHNGNIFFSLSDPEKEFDKESLGHINAITSIGASNKQGGNSIGKFGIGFKSVFRYTNLPHIEDDHFSFDIQDYIVPVMTPRVKRERKEKETYFLFPFKNPESAYADILIKIRTLHKPLFFLTHLKKITWVAEDGKQGSYQTTSTKSSLLGRIRYDFVTLRKEEGGKEETNRFHRYMDGCAIAFATDERMIPQALPSEEPIFCFFPTKEKSPLPFAIHAPFLLTDNREGVKIHEIWNQQQIAQIGEIAAQALLHLAQSGLLKDKLFDLIPTEKKLFFKKGDDLPLAPIYTAILHALQQEKLFYTDDGQYTDAAHTRDTDDAKLRDLFSGEKEALIEGGKDPKKWCFKDVRERDDIHKAQLINYLQENRLISSMPTAEDILPHIQAIDIETSNIDWLKKLYEYLSKGTTKTQGYPIFLCADGKAKALFNQGDNSTPLLGANTGDPGKSIHPELWNDEKCRRSLARLGIKEPGLYDEIEQRILPLYIKGETSTLKEDETNRHLSLFCEYYQACPPLSEERDRFVNRMKDIAFLPVTGQNEEHTFATARQCVLRTTSLHDYLAGNPDIYFFDNQTIINSITPERRACFYEFLSDIGVTTKLEIRTIPRTPQEAKKKGLELNPTSLRQYDKGDQKISDKEIIGWDYFIQHLTPQRSSAFFKLLSEEVQRSTSFLFAQTLAGEYSYVEKGKQGRTFQKISTTARKVIFEGKWMYNDQGELQTPKEIGETNHLSQQYDIATNDIFFFLGIKISEDIKGLTKDQKESIDIVNKFKAKGFTINDMKKILEKLGEKGENYPF